MKYWDGLKIPNGVTFKKGLKLYDVEEHPVFGVSTSRRCAHVTDGICPESHKITKDPEQGRCYNCIYSGRNAAKRAEYFQFLQQNKTEKQEEQKMKKQLEWDDLQNGDWVLTTARKGDQAFVEVTAYKDGAKSYVGSLLDRRAFYTSKFHPEIYPAVVVRPHNNYEFSKLQGLVGKMRFAGSGPVDVNELVKQLRSFAEVYERSSEVEFTVSNLETYLKDLGKIPKDATLKIVKED